MRGGFTSVVIAGARLLLLCTTSVTLGAATSGAASGEDQLYYHYFKERRPLKLDTQRVAILQTRTATAAGLGQAVSRFGLAPQETRGLPIAGWSLAGTPAASHTEPATRDLVSRMSGDIAFEFVAPVFAGEDGGPNIVTPDLLVGFEPSVTEQRAEAILAELNAGDILQRRFGNMNGAYHLRTRLKSGLDVLDVANKLAERPEVRFAEPDMIFTGHGDLIPNDPGFTNLWGMQNTVGTIGLDMKGPQAWDITTGSSNIIVVIIDVGVQANHPDINQIPGTNFTSDASFDGGPVNICDNHGTAVAGCVSARINNNLGTVGIAPGCRCASARAFIANNSCDNTWTTFSSWTVNALAWAQSIGARVSNNSNNYGLPVQSSAIAAMYSSTRAAGMVHFASAGNDATNAITYPASLPGVNAVAALQDAGGLASFSNHGTGLAFSAPGVGIYTTDRSGISGYTNGDYVFSDGTSLASPYAAGIAALVLSINPSLSATNVEQIMQQSCVDLGLPGYDTTYGWGLVNAYNAVVLALALPPATITVTNTADSGAGTLRAALARAANGDTIDASGVTGTILLTSGELRVTNSVTILGPGPANLAVNGNAASRVFNISGTVVTIAGLTITNGKASGGGFPANSGGGIYTGPGTLNVSNCTLSGNSASANGGGILGNHSILTVATCTFSSNSAGGQGGGGIFINAVFGSGTLNVSNCTLVGNSASADSGGAIYNNGQASGNGTVQIVNSTLIGNSAGYGAGIINDGHSSGSATLTVSASTVSGNSASANGGGIYNGGYTGSATLTVSNCILSGNWASNDSGGGIFNTGASSGNGTAQIVNSTLSGNSASGYGGGIFNNGNSGNATLLVSASTLSSNSASGSGGGICNNAYAGSGTTVVSASTFTNNSAISYGGAIYNRGINGSATLTVSASTLRANSAQYGGSLFNDGTSSGNATLLMSATTVSGNSASNDGGGIYNDGYTGRAALTVSNSTLNGNLASGAGAGIYNNGKSSGTGIVQIATSTLSGNSASGNGGGIYNDGTSSGKATLTVKASTFSGNSATGGSGGGIRNDGGGGSASVEIGSTILKAGASGGNIANLSGTVSSDGYNLTSDDGSGFLTGSADQINTDPMLGPLQDNGGPTFTHALICGSPAMDRGKNLTASATDQRGADFARAVVDPALPEPPGGDGTDIGAFEAQQLCPVAVSLSNVGVVSTQFGFDITGGSNRAVVVEASTNLVNWTALATNTLGANPLHFRDPGWTNFPQQFYRLSQ